MQRNFELTTNRLVLRVPKIPDKRALVEHLNDYEVAKWLTNVPFPYSEADAEDWIQRVNEAIHDEGASFQLSIFKHDALIGGIGLRHSGSGRYELGYWLARAHWGGGLVLEAATELLRYAQDKLNDIEVVAHCMKGNSASARVLQKLGFEVIAEKEVFSLSRNAPVAALKLRLT